MVNVEFFFMRCLLIALISTALLTFISSCTKIQRDDQADVSSIIEKRLNKIVQWNKGCHLDEEVNFRIQSLVKQELTADAAVQIALLNNPRIQSIFENIGISQADLIEAGLFSNPVFDLLIRYPNKKNFVADIEYTITASFIDLFLIPVRKKVAREDLEKVTLIVTNEILDLAFEVERTFYELQAAQQEFKYAQSIAEISGIINEISSRQQAINNINLLEYEQIQSQFLMDGIEISRFKNNIIRIEEKLNQLLGFSGIIQWTIANDFPPTDDQSFPLKRLECIAFKERLDLQAARFEILRLSRKLGVKQWWVYTNGRLGLAGERDPNGLNTLGPAFTGEIPIFNYGQAARARLHAELRQAEDGLAALEIQILSEVREAHKELMNNLNIIHDYRSKILPLQKKILASSEELYNVMGLGIDKLLENKRKELLTNSKYILSLRDYWIARVQLDRALGGALQKVFFQEDEWEIPFFQEETVK